MHKVPMPPIGIDRNKISKDCMKLKEPDGLEIDFSADGYFGCSDPDLFVPPLLPQEIVATPTAPFTLEGYIPQKKGEVYLGFIDTDDNNLYIVDLTIADKCPK
jgi:hypothetical protein